MAKKELSDMMKVKGTELKDWFKDLDAKVEDWKFSVEDTKAGTRVELHAVAFIKHPGKE